MADALYAGQAMHLFGNSVCLAGDAAVYLEILVSLPSVVEWVQAAVEEGAENDRAGCNASEVATSSFAVSTESSASGPHSTTKRPASDARTSDAPVKPIGAGTRRRH